MDYKIWNKKDAINGVNCDYVLERYNVKDSDTIFLVIDAYDNVTEIQFVGTIKSMYKMSSTLTDDEVAQEYLRIKEEEKLQTEKDQLSLEEQAIKISILEKQNKELEDAILELASII